MRSCNSLRRVWSGRGAIRARDRWSSPAPGHWAARGKVIANGIGSPRGKRSWSGQKTDMIQVVAFSGGKDSTAMALRMADLDEEFVLLFTPTFNELPEVLGHIKAIQARVGKRLVIPPNRSLIDWIRFY